jgi:hypothetical protein
MVSNARAQAIFRLRDPIDRREGGPGEVSFFMKQEMEQVLEQSLVELITPI